LEVVFENGIFRLLERLMSSGSLSTAARSSTARRDVIDMESDAYTHATLLPILIACGGATLLEVMEHGEEAKYVQCMIAGCHQHDSYD
jgi:gamma-glutamyl-gamma-aminobutyrate hydrolase PuuD